MKKLLISLALFLIVTVAFTAGERIFTSPTGFKFNVNSTDRLEVDTSGVDVTGTFDATGNSTIGGTLDVTGALTSAAIDSSGSSFTFGSGAAVDQTMTIDIDANDPGLRWDESESQLQYSDDSSTWTSLNESDNIAVIVDRKSNGTAGGTFTSGSPQTRDLTTIVEDQDWVSLNSNQFTLSPGAYLIQWCAPAYKVEKHVSVLYSVTSTNYLESGMNANTNGSTDEVTTTSCGSFVHTIASSTTYEIRHEAGSTVNSEGFGRSNGFNILSGDDEYYTSVVIKKLR